MNQHAFIFDIKKFAVHDGPGIRTTFFLMGCPLRCKWCQNPESFESAQQLCLMRLKCIGCGECQKVCEKIGDDFLLSQADCTLCGKCISACKTGARHFLAKSLTPQEVVAIAEKDAPFFLSSGGGVTFSGGECLLHADFVAECARLLKEKGIETIIDTCGAVPFSEFEKVLPYTSCFLYDIKKLDTKAHQKLTGRGNEQILENLIELCKRHASVIIRVPLIPGYTDKKEDIAALADFILNKLDQNIVRVELLPYNKLAESKYENSTAYRDWPAPSYPLGSLTPQTNEEVSALAEILKKAGIPVFAEKL